MASQRMNLTACPVAGRVGVGDQAHVVPAVELDVLVGLHPVVARVVGIDAPVFQQGAAHVFLDPAQEVDAGLVAAALPEGLVDPALVVDQEKALPLGGHRA
jgi:hypothetical protein